MRPSIINIGESTNIVLELERAETENETTKLLIVTTIQKHISEQLQNEFKNPSARKATVFSSSHDGMGFFSEELRSMSMTIEKELDELSTHYLHLLCWRHRIFGGPHRLECGIHHMRWAQEKEGMQDEKFLAHQWPCGITTIGLPKTWKGDISLEDIKSRYAPLYYELLSDGVRAIYNSPRSALVMLVAAIETAIKHYITVAVPYAGWLVENLQSPPLVRLLSSYLELLPAKNGHVEWAFRLPKSDLQTIEKSVSIRNAIVHGQDKNIGRDFLEELRKVAAKTAYYIDWLRGEEWAYEFMSDEIKKEVSTYHRNSKKRE